MPGCLANASVPWLLLGAFVPLAYYSGVDGDVPWSIRLVEFGVPLLAAIVLALRRRFEGAGKVAS